MISDQTNTNKNKAISIEYPGQISEYLKNLKLNRSSEELMKKSNENNIEKDQLDFNHFGEIKISDPSFQNENNKKNWVNTKY